MKTEIHLVELQNTREGSIPFGIDDPYGICDIGANKRSAFEANPFNTDSRTAVQLVGTVDGKAVGGMMFFPGRIVLGGKPHDMHWCSTLYVVPEFRNSLLGILLIMEGQNRFHTLGVCNVSIMAHPVFKKLGWVDMPLARYLLMRKSRSVLERFLGPGVRTALLRPVVDAALLLHRGILRCWTGLKTRGVYCRQVESMPESMDELLTETVGQYGCYRSSNWMNWVLGSSFDTDPRNNKRLYFVVDRKENPLAYFVTRTKFYPQASHRGFKNVLLGSVLDWMVFDKSVLSDEGLWLMATNLLSAQGVDAVDISTNSPEAARSLPRIGFRRMGQFNTLFVSDDEGPVIEEAQIPQWRLRPIDGDSGIA